LFGLSKEIPEEANQIISVRGTWSGDVRRVNLCSLLQCRGFGQERNVWTGKK
jgi:hypothetical protein